MAPTTLSRAERRELERSFAPVANKFVTAAKDVVGSPDPLEAEAWASSMLGVLGGMDLVGIGDTLDVLGPVVVDAAAKKQRPEAAAMLLAFRAVAPPPLAERAAQAARRLEGMPRPAWSELIGKAQPTTAWRCGDLFGDQEVIILGFAYPDGSEHSLSVLVDHNLGMVKDAYIGDAADQVAAIWRAEMAGQPLAVEPENIDVGDAAALVGPALEVTTAFADAPVSEDFEHTRVLLQARLRTLPDVSRDPTSMQEQERDALLAQFLDSPEAAGLDREAAEDVAELLVDFRCDYGDDKPLRWSPDLVAEFLLDWVPRGVLRPEEILAEMPAVLEAWVRYAARRTALPAHALEETLAALSVCREQFPDAVDDPDAFGPAKSVALAMTLDGVDLEDDLAVRRWIDDFNAEAGLPPF